MEHLQRQLAPRSRDFADPGAYQAGVRDALAAVTSELIEGEVLRIVRAMRAHPSVGRQLPRAAAVPPARSGTGASPGRAGTA